MIPSQLVALVPSPEDIADVGAGMFGEMFDDLALVQVCMCVCMCHADVAPQPYSGYRQRVICAVTLLASSIPVLASAPLFNLHPGAPLTSCCPSYQGRVPNA